MFQDVVIKQKLSVSNNLDGLGGGKWMKKKENLVKSCCIVQTLGEGDHITADPMRLRAPLVSQNRFILKVMIKRGGLGNNPGSFQTQREGGGYQSDHQP